MEDTPKRLSSPQAPLTKHEQTIDSISGLNKAIRLLDNLCCEIKGEAPFDCGPPEEEPNNSLFSVLVRTPAIIDHLTDRIVTINQELRELLF